MTTTTQLITAVRAMRHAQKDYFKSRTGGRLQTALRAEAAVDALLAQLPPERAPVKVEQKELFGG